MTHARKMCFDRILPEDLNRPQPVRMINGNLRAISPIGKQWINGSTIRIRFMGGSQAQQDMVRDIAPEWTEYANLDFDFTDDPWADIRITFDASDGAWSYVGTDNTRIPLHAATMNLGWVDRGVILHEFGHMIGLAHEHSSSQGGIVWNEEAVIADLSGPPNYWDEATIRHNVLNKYDADQIFGTEFDIESIMLYAFPDEWTRNMGPTPENNNLSAQDKAFVASANMYPGRTTDGQSAVQEIAVCHSTAQEISEAGEEDVFTFAVSEPARHIVETHGTTDVVMVLFGPDNQNLKIAEDDDGGEGLNPLISAHLSPGQYFVAVRHFDPGARGAYKLQVRAL